MKTVTYTKDARKQLKALPVNVQGQIKAKIEAHLTEGAGSVKALKGRDDNRLRSGDYRVIFIETAAEFQVVAVGHRKGIYR